MREGDDDTRNILHILGVLFETSPSKREETERAWEMDCEHAVHLLQLLFVCPTIRLMLMWLLSYASSLLFFSLSPPAKRVGREKKDGGERYKLKEADLFLKTEMEWKKCMD
ncbi:hypothetical protein TNIN_336831 [Trichonephila inaurata madagascariensis]|uniref:Uncharacterized protein n=1 Tax=Trichonephila inaurata madagascariensis TaxID=2747483 RepID=A0A8X7BNX9_9ARAC|nr:hypothetical protein TNIN_336831 [Trichonephila inaurata madagascariensis]